MSIPPVVPGALPCQTQADRGKMPRTAMAICALYGIPYFYSLYCLIVYYFSDEISTLLGSIEENSESILLWVIIPVTLSCITSLLLLIGFFLGHRLAWYFYRTIGLFFTIIESLTFISHSAFAGSAVLFGDTSISEAIISILPALISLTTSWAIYFLLGTETARKFFGVICPNCHSKKVRMVGLLAGRAKCKSCQREWR